MHNVFVINDMNHSFEKAGRYGTLAYVTEGKVPIFKTDVARNMLKAGLKEFTADDYLLISGPALLCMMAVLIVRDLIGDVAWEIKTLVFDAKEQDYVVRHLSL